MKIIDLYCGIGPWGHRDPLLPYEPQEILKLLDHFGITQAVIHANLTRDHGSTLRGNRMVVDACRGTSRFLPALSAAPTVNHDVPRLTDYLDAMRAAQAKAVWFAPRSAGAPARIYANLFAACEAHRLPLLVNRDDLQPEDFFRIMEQHPQLRLIMLGAAYTEDYLLYRLLDQFPEFRVGLGQFYIPAGNPTRFLQRYPADRLLFGSGLPGFSPGGLIGHVMFADIAAADKEKILHGNAENLFAEVAL